MTSSYQPLPGTGKPQPHVKAGHGPLFQAFYRANQVSTHRLGRRGEDRRPETPPSPLPQKRCFGAVPVRRRGGKRAIAMYEICDTLLPRQPFSNPKTNPRTPSVIATGRFHISINFGDIAGKQLPAVNHPIDIPSRRRFPLISVCSSRRRGKYAAAAAAAAAFRSSVGARPLPRHQRTR